MIQQVDQNRAIEHEHPHVQNRFAVIPTYKRLDADPRFTGRGVTIALLDSGFYPHKDLVEPLGRVKAFYDVTGEVNSFQSVESAEPWMWHGTQTSVVAAGSGALSDGIYHGLASDADIVLVKVGDHRGRITEDNIARAFEWVIENRELYNIRIVNISLGGDEDVPCSKSTIDLAAEKAIQNGIVVVAAAGNSGNASKHHSIPPANSPSVITVGGYDDQNQLDNEKFDLYHSNYGTTADGTVKPEVIAPAMWVAAPILPGTDAYRTAECLSELSTLPDYELKSRVGKVWREAGFAHTIQLESPSAIRDAVETRLRENKIIATHYQHVDGTSFASPIVASIIAQMIEANTNLTPSAIKNILVSTADRMAHAPAIRQGFGAVNARRAIAMAVGEQHFSRLATLMPPRVENEGLVFLFHDDNATTVSLASDLNDWNHLKTAFTREDDGLWRRVVSPSPGPGRYRYKLVIDGSRWIEDPSNGFKEPDGFGGIELHYQHRRLRRDVRRGQYEKRGRLMRREFTKNVSCLAKYSGNAEAGV